MFAISDGVDSVLALFTPQSYGASPEEAIYTVEGMYTYADGGESRYARLYFSNGVLRQVSGFTGEGGTGAPPLAAPLIYASNVIIASRSGPTDTQRMGAPVSSSMRRRYRCAAAGSSSQRRAFVVGTSQPGQVS
jgi:hypothetical protein